MPQIKRRFLKYKKILFVSIGLVLSVVFLFFIYQKVSPIAKFISKNQLSPFFFVSLLFQKTPKLKLEEGRANFVILGVSGGSHEGANLTDSIILLSLDFKNKDAFMISIPRDLWLASLKTKINSVYYYGQKKKKKGGFILAKSALSEVLGIQPSYAVILDFTAFEKIIDLLQGVDIDVAKSFEDKLFPIPGKENDLCGGDPQYLCRYETVRFEKGIQHMDGSVALKYVRSRYSEDEEGTDFSRSKRQHQVISAIISKIKGMKQIKNLPIFKKIFDESYKYLETDMLLSELLSLGKYFYFNPEIKIRELVLDTGNDVQNIPGLLVNPPVWEYDGAWVLVPRTGSYDEIHEYISCQLKKGDCKINPL